MYSIKDKKQEKKFFDLMESLKKTNLDWLNLRQSKDYRVGMVICKIISSIKKFKFNVIIKDLKRWNIGLKTKIKYKEKTIKSNSQSNCELSNYFSDERIAIYTSIFGAYDKITEPYFIPDNCDFYIFTDQKVSSDSCWKQLPLPKNIEKMSNVEKNRYIKMFPNELFQNYKYSIYVDGNVQIISDLTEYINKINSKIGLGIHKHHLRDCVYDELVAVCKSGRISKKDAEKHKKYLEKCKMPKNYGLLQCNVIVREHNNKTCIKIMKEWWNEFLLFSKRDQISLPHVLYNNKVTIDEVATLGDNIYRNPSFRVISHK